MNKTQDINVHKAISNQGLETQETRKDILEEKLMKEQLKQLKRDARDDSKDIQDDILTETHNNRLETKKQTQLLKNMNKHFSTFLFMQKDLADDLKKGAKKNNNQSPKGSNVISNVSKKKSIGGGLFNQGLTVKDAILGAGALKFGPSLIKAVPLLLGRVWKSIDDSIVSLVKKGAKKGGSKLNQTKVAKSIKSTSNTLLNTAKKNVSNVVGKVDKKGFLSKAGTKVSSMGSSVANTKVFQKGLGGLSKFGAFGKGVISKFPLLTVALGAYDFNQGMKDAKSIFDLKPNEKLGTRRKMVAGVSSVIDGFTFGLLDESTTAKTLDPIVKSVTDLFDFGEQSSKKDTFVNRLYNNLSKEFKDSKWLDSFFNFMGVDSKKSKWKKLPSREYDGNFSPMPSRGSGSPSPRPTKAWPNISKRSSNVSTLQAQLSDGASGAWRDWDKKVEGTGRIPITKKYRDTAGVWTMGGGVNIEARPYLEQMINSGQLTNEQEVMDLIGREEMDKLLKLRPEISSMSPDAQQFALAMAKNAGGTGASKFMSSINAFDRKDFDKVRSNMKTWGVTDNHKRHYRRVMRAIEAEDATSSNNVAVKSVPANSMGKIKEAETHSKQIQEKKEQEKIASMNQAQPSVIMNNQSSGDGDGSVKVSDFELHAEIQQQLINQYGA